MYQQSDLPLIEKRLLIWERTFRERIAQLVAAYERPESIFPEWLLPHPRRIEVTVTPVGAAITTYAADDESFSINWLPEGGLEAATRGFFQWSGPGVLEADIKLAEFTVTETNPNTGEQKVVAAVEWEHLWLTGRLRANDLRPDYAIIEAERDILTFTTQHLLGLEQQGSQTDAGVVVATRLDQLADEFEELLDAEGLEEDLQRFLRDNPALLDLRAISVQPKVKLGSQYVTDFVVQLPRDAYVLVEIERSTHPLYNQGGNPSAALTHAVQQVEDWLEWAYDNLTYLRSTLPGVHEPSGLVILGRRASLTEKAAKALRRRNSTSKVQVVTFDDLLEQIRAIATNLRPK